MRSLFIEVRATVEKALSHSFTITRALSLLGIARSWYYRYLDPDPIIDKRFNASSIINEEWIVVGYKRRHLKANHREIAYALMDDDIAYISPSSVYRILKKYDLVRSWVPKIWFSKRKDMPSRPDETWQSDIMYVSVLGIFYYLIIFIDVYSRYIVHYSLMVSMDGDSVSSEAQVAIEKLRKDSLSTPVIQTDNGSGYISHEFNTILRQNGFTQKRIKPHNPTDNAYVERANRTVREEIETHPVTNYQEAVTTIDKTVCWYNNERRHSSLHYLTPIQYYRGDPDLILAVREAKIEMAKNIRREENMKQRNGGEPTGSLR